MLYNENDIETTYEPLSISKKLCHLFDPNTRLHFSPLKGRPVKSKTRAIRNIFTPEEYKANREKIKAPTPIQ